MSRAKLIDYYLENSYDVDFQIDQIRKELAPKNIPEEDIKAIVRVVDSAILTRAFTKDTNDKSNEILVAGVVLTFVGAGITIGTYMGLINTGDSFLIVYGPLIGGVSMIFGGMAQRKKGNKPKIDSKRRKLG